MSRDDRFYEASVVTRAALDLAADANSILNDKWWKRTRTLRRWSNSLRKRRGKEKKTWPTHFDLDEYLIRAQISSTPPIQEVELEKPTVPRFLPPPSMEFVTAPRTAVVAMARNEAHRAHYVMRHFCALFDRIVVIDHLSDDSTGSIAAGYGGTEGAQVHVLRSDELGYHQADYMTAAATALLTSGSVDWIFFLDFDEFLPFASREDFNQALVQFADKDVISGHWINCLLDEPEPADLAGCRAITSEVASPYLKVALNARRLSGRKVKMSQGNHAVRLDDDAVATVGARAFGILHLPIISIERLRAKLERGIPSYEALGQSDSADGFHWRELHGRLDDLARDPHLLRRATLRYGEPLEEVLAEDPPAERPIDLRFALAPKARPLNDAGATVVSRETLAPLLGALLPSNPKTLCEPTLHAIYKSLDGSSRTVTAKGRAARVEHALLSGAQDLNVIVPTAWAGHEPFLFSLMEAARPRRYVELGTHAGHSFFTACQHYKANGNYGEAVAIDLWEGDHQAGFYDEGVFERFRFLLDQHYSGCGRYIRSLFHEAATAFEPASIDLLHIDGLHTYSAVRDDYQTWRSRVTDTGTIIFHDTSEFQTDFGVWQLFNEVRSDGTASFNFQHSHGLGVVAFGTPDTNPAVEFVQHLSKNPALYERHYANLGKAMFRAAQSRLTD